MAETKNRKSKAKRKARRSDVFDLDRTVARFVLPRLREFRRLTDSHPTEMTMGEWRTVIGKMIAAMECYECYRETSASREGARLFGKYFGYLWI